MQNYEVLQYSFSDKDKWDAFLSESNQNTFLFYRDFMDYHSDRFKDNSLMIHKNKKLIAMLPANKIEDNLYSHQGLSYGGFINKSDIKTEDYIEVFKATLKFLNSNNIDKLHIKELPCIYLSNAINNPMAYLCFKTQAKVVRTDMHSIIDMNFKKLSNSRKEGLSRGQKHNLIVKESDNFDLFWNKILIPNLRSKHRVQPVHSLEEMNFLKSKFPKQIRQFNVYHQNKIVAGTTIFENENVVHCQYISGNTDKNELGSLDFLHVYLIENVFYDKVYFSFGTSNVEAGQKVNQGLQFWKEGFGARSVNQGFYQIETENYKLLEDLFI